MPALSRSARYPPVQAGAIAAALRDQGSRWAWRLWTVSTCATSESLLLRCGPKGACLPAPCAVFARQQRRGRGQGNHRWCSPPGGVWVSAALPIAALPSEVEGRGDGLGLAIPLALIQWLERLGVDSAALKWPNDILVGNRKLAGLLLHRHVRGGVLRQLRLGLGMNVNNPVPVAAVGLKDLLGRYSVHLPEVQAACLIAVERAVESLTDLQTVLLNSEARLWRRNAIVNGPDGEMMRIAGLTTAGGLRLEDRNGGCRIVTTGTWRLPRPPITALRGYSVARSSSDVSVMSSVPINSA